MKVMIKICLFDVVRLFRRISREHSINDARLTTQRLTVKRATKALFAIEISE